VLVELGCVCATAEAAVRSRHTPRNDKTRIVFIGLLLKWIGWGLWPTGTGSGPGSRCVE
jgi:hypothetical protein